MSSVSIIGTHCPDYHPSWVLCPVTLSESWNGNGLCGTINYWNGDAILVGLETPDFSHLTGLSYFGLNCYFSMDLIVDFGYKDYPKRWFW
uniref:Uncharacterized protein n=1 Tax=Arundo donax TaxID=35708 RepID=A0A0A9HQC2_ARUDO